MIIIFFINNWSLCSNKCIFDSPILKFINWYYNFYLNFLFLCLIRIFKSRWNTLVIRWQNIWFFPLILKNWVSNLIFNRIIQIGRHICMKLNLKINIWFKYSSNHLIIFYWPAFILDMVHLIIFVRLWIWLFLKLKPIKLHILYRLKFSILFIFGNTSAITHYQKLNYY